MNPQEILPMNSASFAFGLQTLLPGNQEQVAELLPQQDSSLVPVATLLPGARIDRPMGRNADSGDSLFRGRFWSTIDPTADNQSPGRLPPISIHNFRDSSDRHFLPSSPTLLDLLLPKPLDETNAGPAAGTNLQQPVLPGGIPLPSSFRNRGDALLKNGSGTRIAEQAGQWGGVLLTLVVLQTLTEVHASKGRPERR
jgi:hypothetical protein